MSIADDSWSQRMDQAGPARRERLVRKFDPVERDFRNRELGKGGEELVLDVKRRKLTQTMSAPLLASTLASGWSHAMLELFLTLAIHGAQVSGKRGCNPRAKGMDRVRYYQLTS